MFPTWLIILSGSRIEPEDLKFRGSSLTLEYAAYLFRKLTPPPKILTLKILNTSVYPLRQVINTGFFRW